MISTLLAALALAQPPQDIPPLPAATAIPAAAVQPPRWIGQPSNVGGNLRLNTDVGTAAQNEFGIAVNPRNPRNFVAGANDYRAGQVKVGFYTSIDGARSVAADGVLPNGGGFPEAGDPAVAFDGNGVAYFLGLGFQRSPLAGGLYVYRSNDGGLTWSAPFEAFRVAGNLPDKPYIAVDQRTSGAFAGSIYLTFTGFGSAPTGLQCVFSRDGGQTWSSPRPIGSGQGTSPAVGPGGELYVAWYGSDTIVFNRSLDGGVTFSGQRTIQTITRNLSPLSPSRFRCNSFPSTAADNSTSRYRGRVYVSWSSRSGTSSEIFLISSSDRGTTWSTPVRLNDVVAGDQYFQWLTVDENGTVFACWHDRRNDPANQMHDCYVTASYDGGATWTPNWRATDRISNPGTTTFLGDYCGIAAGGGMVYPTWVDTRNGNQDIYTAPVQADLEFSPTSFSAAAGGTVNLEIKAGPAHAGETFVTVANFTGVNSIGIPIGGGRFYLNYDPLVDVSFSAGNAAPFLDFRGILGPNGIAASQPRFTPSMTVWAPLVGLDVSVQYLLLDASPDVSYGSNPVSIRVNP